MADERVWGELDECGLGMREVTPREYLHVYHRRPVPPLCWARQAAALAWMRLADVFSSEGAWVLVVVATLPLSLAVGLGLARAAFGLSAGPACADVVSLAGVAGGFLAWSLALAGWCARQMAAEEPPVTRRTALPRSRREDPPVRAGILRSLMEQPGAPSPRRRAV